MKKQLLTLGLCFVSMLAFSQVQINEHAIGMRIGGGNSFGSQVSYQYGLSNYNRVEVDLGFNSNNNGNGFNLTGVYQWVWDIESGFNWYAGPAATIGSWSYKSDYDGSRNSGTYLGIGGQIGAEYNFSEVPIMLSLDTQPMFGLTDVYNSFNMGLSLSVRYTF